MVLMMKERENCEPRIHSCPIQIKARGEAMKNNLKTLINEVVYVVKT